MKTSVNLGKLDEVKIHDEPATAEKINIKLTHGRCCKVSAIVSIVLFLVAASTFTSLYYFRHTTDHTKQYELTIHYEDGVQKTEHVVVTDKEEEFETDDVYLIYDFSTGLIVMSFKNDQHGFQDCYVHSFNMSEIPTPEEIKNKYPDSKIDMTVGDKIMEENLEVTDIWMNSESLGPRSRDICQGKDVYFLNQFSDEYTRVTRRAEKERETVVSIFWGLIKIRTKTKE